MKYKNYFSFSAYFTFKSSSVILRRQNMLSLMQPMVNCFSGNDHKMLSTNQDRAPFATPKEEMNKAKIFLKI